ncbi:hypothetical protein INS49_010947 [Diaporthe citri]|uniref:uncharacterized protein n=1 Tax=Diaporthe citri TaxID=83186 RepID=UPI001C7ED5E1|nr:uncharacterized protein INS49_010947 [Diaporthe citri]KAG6359894.1 hypothetical protein INS49_010947 [Diaporthe citri]
MKLFSIGVLLLAAFQITLGAAADSAVSAPACGLKCIVTAVAEHSTCGLTDTACICLNKELNLAAAACIAKSCSVRDQLATQKYSKHTCGVEGEDRTALVWIIGIVFGILGFIAFCLRVASRVFVGTHATWGPEDWVMTVAVVLMIPLAVLSVPLANYGLGKDMWEVEPDNITKILYLYFWDELVYLAVLPVTKISILLFYLKIFPKREVKIAIWVLVGFNIAYLIVFEVISIFQCRPIAGAWLAWDKTFEATCNDINMQGWMAAALNLVLDLSVIILPLPELAGLSLSLRKKIQILSMFCVGFFVTIVSALRLQSLAKYANTSNVTQDYVEVGYWSTIEVPVGVICACMPAIRSLIATIFPKVFGTTQQKSDYTGISGGSKQWSFGRLNSSGKHIKVKTEWTVRSHNVPEHEESQVELVPLPSPGTLQQPLPTRPPSELAVMQTSCERAKRS